VEAFAMQQTYGFDPSHSPLLFLFSGLFGLVILLLVISPHWFIFKKAGFSPWLSLLMFVPLVNLFMLYFLAFARWNVVPATMVYAAPPPVPYQPPLK
jgi:hypothetical protein